MKRSYQYLAQRTNDAGGIYLSNLNKSLPVELHIVNDDSNASYSEHLLHELLHHTHPVAVLGSYGPETSANHIHVVNGTNIPYMSPSHAPTGGFHGIPNVLSMIPDRMGSVKALFHFFHDKILEGVYPRPSKVTLLLTPGEYGESFAHGAMHVMKEYPNEFELVLKEHIMECDTSGFDHLADEAIQAGTDILVADVEEETFASFHMALMMKPHSIKAISYGMHGGEEHIRKSMPMGTSGILYWQYWSGHASNRESFQFIDDWDLYHDEQLYFSDCERLTPTWLAATAYEGFRLTLKAIESAGSLHHEDINLHLRTLNVTDSIFGGDFSFAHNGLAVYASSILQNGHKLSTQVLFPEWQKTTEHILLVQSFEPHYWHYPHAHTRVWLGVSFSVGIVCLLCAALFFRFRKNQDIRAAAYPFMITTSLGCALICISTFLFVTVPTSDTFCSLRVWLVPIGIGTTIGAILVKTWRISRIFGLQRLQVNKMSHGLLFFYLFLILCGYMSISLAWQVVDRPRLVLGENGSHSAHEGGMPSEMLIECSSNAVFSWVFYSYSFLLISWGAKLAFHVRDVPHFFNEARQLGACIGNIFLGMVLLVAMQSAVSDSATTLSSVRVLVAMYIVVTIVAILFVPLLLGSIFESTQTNSLFVQDSSRIAGTGTGTGTIKGSNGLSSYSTSMNSKGNRFSLSPQGLSASVVPMSPSPRLSPRGSSSARGDPTSMTGNLKTHRSRGGAGETKRLETIHDGVDLPRLALSLEEALGAALDIEETHHPPVNTRHLSTLQYENRRDSYEEHGSPTVFPPSSPLSPHRLPAVFSASSRMSSLPSVHDATSAVSRLPTHRKVSQ